MNLNYKIMKLITNMKLLDFWLNLELSEKVEHIKSQDVS